MSILKVIFYLLVIGSVANLIMGSFSTFIVTAILALIVLLIIAKKNA